MKQFGFKDEAPAAGNVAKVVKSLDEYLDRNTGEAGFFARYRLAIVLGGVATAGAVVATVWLHRDPNAKQALQNIAHQAYLDGGETVNVSVEEVQAQDDAGEK